MVKGSRQKFKQRFRKSNIIPPTFRNNYIPTDQKDHESTSQVSTLLDKLRKETRFDNGTVSTNISSTLPQPAFNYLMREHAEREQQERGEREVMRQRVSGPAPPKSWQEAWQGKSETTELLIKYRKGRRRAWDDSTFPTRKTKTLLEICSKTVAINIKSYISYPYFANIPTHLKQCILSSLSVYNPLTEEILPLFNTDIEYEELDLANSTINLESFKKSFWKIVKEKDLVNNLVRNWEDLADQDEETDIICSRIFGKPMDITNDDGSTITNKLISKLPKLRKLNLGFAHNISGIPLSTLLVATLPLLTHLSIAGCFNRVDGPHSLRILSGLINLLILDISYCEWATDQILLQFINWDRDLKSLRILVAVNCGSWKDVEIVRKKLSENRRSFELCTE